MRMKAFVSMCSIAMFLSVAMPIFAEQAPVFDANDQPSDFINPPAPQANNEAPVRPANEELPNQAQAQVYNSSLNADQRLLKLEQQINNLQSNDEFSRVDSLQKEIQSLRGQVEELSHQLQQVQTQQRTMYADLDKRLAQQNNATSTPKDVLPENPAASSVMNAPTNDTAAKSLPTDAAAKPASLPVVNPNTEKTEVLQPNVAEEQEIYQTAYNLIKEKKYNDAVNALRKMLKKYPSGQFAANAHYWLGELYGLMGKSDNALTEFDTVVKQFPKSPRISDAQLKLGLIYASRSKWVDAKNAFKKVIAHYPGTASAQLASEQLKQIKLAGH